MAIDRDWDPPGRVSSPPMVLLDTNALMMPGQLDVRLDTELERLLGNIDAVVPTVVYTELERIAEHGTPSEASAAAVGREIADRIGRQIDTESDDADPAIVELAEAGIPDYVVTNDTPLRNRVLDADIPVISLRGRTKLAIIHP